MRKNNMEAKLESGSSEEDERTSEASWLWMRSERGEALSPERDERLRAAIRAGIHRGRQRSTQPRHQTLELRNSRCSRRLDGHYGRGGQGFSCLCPSVAADSQHGGFPEVDR